MTKDNNPAENIAQDAIDHVTNTVEWADVDKLEVLEKIIRKAGGAMTELLDEKDNTDGAA